MNKIAEPLTFMIVHAHPDDEVLSSGGTLARLSSEGIKTVLVMATLGEAGKVVDPDLDEIARRRVLSNLGETRLQELKASIKALHISELRILGYRDSGRFGDDANKFSTLFYLATFDEVVKQLVQLIREFKPQVIATYDRFGGYGHPDHIQTHRATLIAFEAASDPRLYPELSLTSWQPSKLYYIAIPRSFLLSAATNMGILGVQGPWNNLNLGTDDKYITTRIDVSSYIESKLQAFKAHRTQFAPDDYMFAPIGEEKRREILGYEWYILGRSTFPIKYVGEFEEDLFNGVIK